MQHLLVQAPILAAVVASVVLLFKVPVRIFPVIALVACGLEALRVFGVLSFKVPVIGAAVLLGAAMVVGGVGSWVKSAARGPATAATLVALVGLVRVLPRVLG